MIQPFGRYLMSVDGILLTGEIWPDRKTCRTLVRVFQMRPCSNIVPDSLALSIFSARDWVGIRTQQRWPFSLNEATMEGS